MRFVWKDDTDLVCLIEGYRPFRMGWVMQDGRYSHWYVKCMWMLHESWAPQSTTSPDRNRPWLTAYGYPENVTFATEEEARKVLEETSAVMVIGGFRGRDGTFKLENP